MLIHGIRISKHIQAEFNYQGQILFGIFWQPGRAIPKGNYLVWFQKYSSKNCKLQSLREGIIFVASHIKINLVSNLITIAMKNK